MTENTSKITAGKMFMELLHKAETKDDLLRLARYALLNSPSQRKLCERNLPEEKTAVRLLAKVAEISAITGKDVSTDSMLIMIENTYQENNFGTPKQFKDDFKKAYPNEYGKNHEQDMAMLKLRHKMYNITAR